MTVIGNTTGYIFIMAGLAAWPFPFLTGKMFEPYGPSVLRWLLLALTAATCAHSCYCTCQSPVYKSVPANVTMTDGCM